MHDFLVGSNYYCAWKLLHGSNPIIIHTDFIQFSWIWFRFIDHYIVVIASGQDILA